jgi:hypothetical protein
MTMRGVSRQERVYWLKSSEENMCPRQSQGQYSTPVSQLLATVEPRSVSDTAASRGVLSEIRSAEVQNKRYPESESDVWFT